jgi:hypothetical protein
MHYWRSCSRPFPAMSSANNACYVCTDIFRACAYAVLFSNRSKLARGNNVECLSIPMPTGLAPSLRVETASIINEVLSSVRRRSMDQDPWFLW